MPTRVNVAGDPKHAADIRPRDVGQLRAVARADRHVPPDAQDVAGLIPKGSRHRGRVELNSINVADIRDVGWCPN